MHAVLEEINKSSLKTDVPAFRAGDTVVMVYHEEHTPPRLGADTAWTEVKSAASPWSQARKRRSSTNPLNKRSRTPVRTGTAISIR